MASEHHSTGNQINVISAVDLSKTYLDGNRTVEALKSIDLEIRKGEKVALLGSSGSGKTTLLNLLAGLDRPDSGDLSLAGQELARLSPSQMASYRRDRIGVVFQSFELISQKTALQNVELPLIMAGTSRRARRDQSTEALQRVGLQDRIQHRPYQLSGGEKQRVAIARAMICEPEILLADEPTGNLDLNSSKTVMELIVGLADDSQTTLLLITHDQQLAEKYADRILTMSDGQIVGDVTV